MSSDRRLSKLSMLRRNLDRVADILRTIVKRMSMRKAEGQGRAPEKNGVGAVRRDNVLPFRPRRSLPEEAASEGGRPGPNNAA